MNDASATRILILAAADAGGRWEAILKGPQTKVWLGRDAIPLGERPEIIVADDLAPQAKTRDSVGVIRVGRTGSADVCLPADCSPDELRRTCRLMSEIVRLRHQHRQAAKKQKSLLRAAMTDPLTGLSNRRAWDVELSRRLAEPGDGRQLCVAVIDLDRLKEVNDTRGHVAGDLLLQTVGRAIQGNMRQDDFPARLGGDEFGLLFWACGEANAAAIIERIRCRIAKSADEIGFAAITASAGFALSEAPLTADAAQTLHLAADMALLAAKCAGRNRCLPNPSATK